MKEYTAKTLEEALDKASKEMELEKEDLVYSIEEEKHGLFSKKVVIAVYELDDIIHYAEDYILGITDSIGIEATTSTRLDDNIIRITVDSTNNPILIGKGGRTLQALNDLTKLAVNNRFKRRFRLLVDINGYKNSRYKKLVFLAKKVAREVQHSKTTAVLDPMPADERRIVHNALHGMRNIKTESKGEGSHRQVQIIYVDSPRKERKPEPEVDSEEE